MAEDLREGVQAGGSCEVKVSFLVEGTGGGQAMNMRMVGEVVAKGVNAQDDACFPFCNSCGSGKAFGEGIRYDAAKHGKALGVAAEDAA